MKILILSHISEFVGGAEKSLVDLLDIWENKYDVELEFILKNPVGTMALVLKERGWKYHGLDYGFWSVRNPPKTSEKIYKHGLKNSKAISDIEKIIQKSKPDIVMTNSVVCPWGALAAYYQKVPHIWFVREYGDLDHGRIFEIGREQTLQDVGSLSDLVITNSKALKKHLSQYIDQDKLSVLYNPFDVDELNKLANQKVKDPFMDNKSLKLVATGSLTPSKGQLEIVKAVATLNAEGESVELCLIGGNGPTEYKKEIQKVINTNSQKNKVHLVGHQKNPLALVALADIGVMASRMEAFGRVTFEYMAVAKPVIGTNTGGTPEMIDSGVNGYLYEPGDQEELVEAIRHYAKNHELIIEQGKKSRAKAESMMNSEFSPQAVFNRVQSIINHPKQKNTPPINYTHKLIDYLQAGGEYIEETGQMSVKKLAKQRLRSRAGHSIRLAKTTARKILKR